MNELDVRRAAPPRRSRKKIILVTAAVVLVIGGAVGLALFQPWKLFTHSTVNEAVPAAFAMSASATAASVPVQPPATAGPSAAPTVAQEPATPPAEPPVEPPTSEPVVLASGTFVDGEHTTTGTATVLQLPDGSRYLRWRTSRPATVPTWTSR